MRTDIFDSALGTSAAGNQMPGIKFLMNAAGERFNINVETSEGYTVLMDVVRREYFKMTAFFLDKGADVNKMAKNEQTALSYACGRGRLDLVRLLVERGACTTGKAGATALVRAVRGRRLTIINYLVHEVKVNVNAQTSNGRTPMSHACETGLLDMVKLLRGFGASVELSCNNRVTPLMWACSRNQVKVVEYLLKKTRVHINYVTKDVKHTALSLACVNGHNQVVRLLIDHGADIKHTVQHESMLMLASRGNHVDVATELLHAAEMEMIDAQDFSSIASRQPSSSPRHSRAYDDALAELDIIDDLILQSDIPLTALLDNISRRAH